MWLRWAVILLSLMEASYMAFDGGRALIVGEYITPASGEFAGQLGPWAQVVMAVGIDPRSTLMKNIFVVYGTLWLITIGAYILRASWSWSAMLIAALGSFWYLPFGTLFSLIQIVLLLLTRHSTPYGKI